MGRAIFYSSAETSLNKGWKRGIFHYLHVNERGEEPSPPLATLLRWTITILMNLQTIR